MQLKIRSPFIFFILFFVFINSKLQSQKIDEAYNQKIKEFTTDPRFLPPSVLNLVEDPRIPSPLKFFGSIVGAPGVMHRTSEIYSYYKALADASPFLKMQQVATSEEGRPIQLVMIGNDDAMKRVDHYKKQLALLADPRKMGNMDLNQLINDAKPVFYLNGGLHSTEMGSPGNANGACLQAGHQQAG